MQTYTIRPLEWEYNHGIGTWFAKPMFQTVEYRVWHLGGTWVWGQEYGYKRHDAESLDAAKLAAEAHWQERIKQALVPVTEQNKENA